MNFDGRYLLIWSDDLCVDLIIFFLIDEIFVYIQSIDYIIFFFFLCWHLTHRRYLFSNNRYFLFFCNTIRSIVSSFRFSLLLWHEKWKTNNRLAYVCQESFTQDLDLILLYLIFRHSADIYIYLWIYIYHFNICIFIIYIRRKNSLY